jgi:hypothetical protein
MRIGLAHKPKVSLPPPTMDPSAALIQRQLDAYNAKDVDAWLSTYAADAEQYELHGPLLARGHAEMRQRIEARFTEPDLHAQLVSRVLMGPFVVDLERITRDFPDGKGSIEMLCVYEVRNQLIAKASFALGSKQLFHP